MVPRIISEVRTAIERDCYIVALMGALTLPDICGKSAYPDMKVGARYTKWCDTYLSPATQKTLEDILQPMARSVESNLACMLKKIIAEFLLQKKSNLFFCWGYYHFNTSKQLTFRTYQRTLFKQYKNKRSIELYGSLDT